MQLTRASALLCVFALACAPEGGARFELPAATDGFTSSGASDATGVTGGATGESSDPGPPPPTPDDSGGPATGAALIPAHATWRYTALQAPIAGDWTRLEFDDSSWPEAQAPFGDEPGALTPVDGASAPLGLRLRRRITVAEAGAKTLRIFMRRGDGAAVYLNGAPLVRSNLGPDPRPDDAHAAVDLKGAEALRYIQLAAPAAELLAGDNVIAVEVRRSAAGATGLHFDLQLEIWDLAAAPGDELSAQVRTLGYGGEYGDDNAAAAWIEDSSGDVVRTLAVWAEVRREHLIRWRAASQGEVADAMTAATRRAHATLELRWDLRDTQGQLAPPGDYKWLVEFTEDDSNKGEPAGPVLAVPFTLGGGPHLVAASEQPQFTDLLIVAP